MDGLNFLLEDQNDRVVHLDPHLLNFLAVAEDGNSILFAINEGKYTLHCSVGENAGDHDVLIKIRDMIEKIID